MRIGFCRRGVRWILALALAVCAAATAEAREYQTADFRLLTVTIDTIWAPRAAPGYFPVRFEIVNSGDARIIEIIGQGMRSYRATRAASGAPTFVRQSVRLGMGDRVRLTLPVPILADSESIRFEIRERNLPTYYFGFNAVQSRAAASDASALVVAVPGGPLSAVPLRSLRAGVSRVAVPALRGGGPVVVRPAPVTTVRAGSGAALDFQLEPARLPTNWLGYTSLRAVVIGPAEWDQLVEGQKDALLAWAAGGGDLFFVDGDVRTLLPSAQIQPATSPDRVMARHLLGRVYGVPSTSLEAGLTDLLTATEPGRETYAALPVNSAPDWGTTEGRGFRLRIPGIEGVPTRVYLSILLLFSVLIGPLNYWILRRKRQQVLMVVTAPLISAAFIVLLAGYAIAGEGFQVHGRAVTFTILDQLTKQAATRATVSLYAAGLTPANGLRVGRDVGVWALGPDGSGTRERMELDLSDAQQFSAGVLQVRSATNLEQVTFRSARERLSFTHADGGLSVTNGLDATVLALVYRDGDMSYRLGSALPSGARQTLDAAAFNPQRALPTGVSIPGKFLGLVQNQPPGSYVAVLEHSPFWDPGVARLSERGSVHVVLGWPEGQR